MGALSFLANLIAYKPYEICQLETTSSIDPHSLLTHDGSMVTLIKLNGAYRFYSNKQELAILDFMASRARQNFTDSGNRIDFVIDIDSSRSESFVNKCLNTVDSVSKTMGYQNEKLNKTEKSLISQLIKPEMTYIVLTTTPQSLDRPNIKEGNENRKKLADEYGHSLSSSSKTQNHWVETMQIYDQHRSFVTEMTNIFSEYVLFEKLESHRALKEIRDLLYRDFENQDRWKPSTRQESSPKIMSNHTYKVDTDEIGHSSIHSQIVEQPFEDAKRPDFKFFNGHCYTTLERYLVGDEPMLMRSFINRVNRDVPMRISYTLVSGSQSIQTSKMTKSSLTTFVAKTNPISSEILKACNKTTKFIQEGGCAVECYMSVTVWGDNETETNTRFKAVQSALRGWGGERQRMCSFPIEGLLSSLPGYSSRPVGRASNDSIETAFSSAPIIRPASPWDSGVLLYITPDGKPWPIDFDSTQSHHLNLVSGSMGSGKSVQAGVLTRAMHFLAGTTSLPLIAGVDYGESILFTAETVRANLKKEDRAKVGAISLANEKTSAYNMLEPQYGYNKLAKPENNTATAFVTKIVNGGSKQPIHVQLDNCVSAIIDSMVAKAISQPRKIDPSQPGVDKIQKELAHHLVQKHLKSESSYSYLNARNALYKASNEEGISNAQRQYFLRLSKIAHRYIWPLISDLPKEVKSAEQQSAMGSFKVGGEKLLDLIGASVQLMTDRYSAILGSYPMVDYSDLSMLFVNAKPVVDSAPAAMKNAWFILAKGLAQRHFWVHEDDVKNDADPVFYKRALRIARAKKPLPKYYFQDEYEQAQCPELDENFDKEVKTARKYREIITLLTQMYEAFPPSIRDLATNTFICNIPGVGTERVIKEQFKLTDDEFESIESYVGKAGILNGMGRGLLYIGKLKKIQAPIIQPIVSVLPPGLVWSLASDAEDVHVRRKVKEALGDSVPYDELNIALGQVLSFPDMKALIKKKGEVDDMTDKDVYIDCINRVKEHILLNGVGT